MVDNIKIEMNKADEKRFKRIAKQLPDAVFRKQVKRSAGKAMTPVNRDAKKLAPKDTGYYRKSIGKKQKTYSRTKAVWTGIGPRKGKPHAYLAHLIEFGYRKVTGGTVARLSGSRAGRADAARSAARTGAGKVVGFVPARPHLRPAMRRNKQKVFRTYAGELQAGIAREAKKV